jgi:tRNA(Ile)-lysidine synthase
VRGEESLADARFVRDVALEMALPYHCHHLDRTKLEGENFEQAARNARREFFTEFINSGAINRVALGHTRSDQAETVLFRILRGTGTAGLSGIRPATSTGFVRPLLGVDRSEAVEWLRARGIEWREDSSNRDLSFDRNRIRHELLPALAREWNPRIYEALVRMAELAHEDEEYWNSQLENLVTGPAPIVLDAELLASAPAAMARRLIRRCFEIVKGDLRSIDFAHVDIALTLARSTTGSGRFQAPGLDIFRSFDKIRFAQPSPPAERNWEFEATVPGAVVCPRGRVRLALDSVEGAGRLDLDRLDAPLQVRNWRPGDAYRPEGKEHRDKLKTMFQETRVPLWERRDWPVLTAGDTVVWAARFGASADHLSSAGTKRTLHVTYHQDKPGTDDC